MTLNDINPEQPADSAHLPELSLDKANIYLYRQINEILTATFVEFQTDRTTELLAEFSHNILPLSSLDVRLMATEAFIKSSRAWLDAIEKKGVEIFTTALNNATNG